MTHRDAPGLEGDTVPLAVYSRALDEIYALRAGAAHEAYVIAESLSYRTMPVRAVDALWGSAERLRQAARGGASGAWHWVPLGQKQNQLVDIGARPTLTRSAWESETHPDAHV